MIIQKEAELFTTTVDDAFKSKRYRQQTQPDGMSYTVNNIAEWNQIFNDTWRWYRDFFYGQKTFMATTGSNGWKIQSYIPYLSSRDELNWLLSQMVGDKISVSHTYVWRGDMGPMKAPETKVYTGWLGADFAPDNLLAYTSLIKPTVLRLQSRSEIAAGTSGYWPQGRRLPDCY